MYKALNYWVYGGFTGEKTPYEFIDFAVEQGLDGIELTVGDALNIDITEAECRKIAAYAAEKNIGLRTLASGFFWGCSLSADDETERQQALEFGKKYIRIANWIGAKTILVIPGATRVAWEPDRPVISYKNAWANATKSIRELLVLAEELNVNIALENVWNRFLLSPMEWKFFLDQFNSKKIGIYFDVANCCIYGRPQDYVEILGDYVKAVHIKNFTETDCAGGLHGFGDDILVGEVDFEALKSALQAINYTGALTAEMIPFCRLPDLVLPDEALAKVTAAKMVELFGK
ncbi:MAG: sugar phosphate isomerase/epimerase [Lentisphaeria bacterium]|nr:sugar phosphate isomerase/epimerase [Lentisphaeria bacterium]